MRGVREITIDYLQLRLERRGLLRAMFDYNRVLSDVFHDAIKFNVREFHGSNGSADDFRQKFSPCCCKKPVCRVD